MMKIKDELKQNLFSAGHATAHISPALDALCGLIDRRLENINKHSAVLHKMATKNDAE